MRVRPIGISRQGHALWFRGRVTGWEDGVGAGLGVDLGCETRMSHGMRVSGGDRNPHCTLDAGLPGLRMGRFGRANYK